MADATTKRSFNYYIINVTNPVDVSEPTILLVEQGYTTFPYNKSKYGSVQVLLEYSWSQLQTWIPYILNHTPQWANPPSGYPFNPVLEIIDNSGVSRFKIVNYNSSYNSATSTINYYDLICYSTNQGYVKQDRIADTKFRSVGVPSVPDWWS